MGKLQYQLDLEERILQRIKAYRTIADDIERMKTLRPDPFLQGLLIGGINTFRQAAVELEADLKAVQGGLHNPHEVKGVDDEGNLITDPRD